MFGADGPFAAQHEGGLSDFQVQMERIGLPVVTVKATGFRILSGEEGVSLNENVGPPLCSPSCSGSPAARVNVQKRGGEDLDWLGEIHGGVSLFLVFQVIACVLRGELDAMCGFHYQRSS